MERKKERSNSEAKANVDDVELLVVLIEGLPHSRHPKLYT